jgi:thioredoxin reductase (NADPH)
VSAPLDTQREEALAFPVLTQAQAARLTALGTVATVAVGDVLYEAGDRDYDFFYLESAEVEIVRGATPDALAEVVARYGPGQFLGELNMLTGQSAYLTARVSVAGLIHRVPRDRFRLLMAQDAELSDLILRAYMARRDTLRFGTGARSVEIVGSAFCAASQALRRWAARQQLPHLWMDVDEPGGAALADALGATADDLPIVVTPTATLRRATPGVVAENLGLSYRPVAGRIYDVVVVGAGPAGLAAAVYGASEGLDTVLFDGVAIGGQAAASARIENYLGFPSGIAGAELTSLALIQAQKFGAAVSTPCVVTRLSAENGQPHLWLSDGSEVDTRAVIVATGARYRSLPLPQWERFEGSGGIYYAATEMEARMCAAEPVTVVGGANSAGQAALFLAGRGSSVTLAVRGGDLAAGMSRYLVDRVSAHPRITIRLETEITGLEGDNVLRAVTATQRSSGVATHVPCRGLFCFIGAVPATDWLTDVTLDPDGFVYTDAHLDNGTLPPAWDLLARRPHPFETSVPGVFAVGDVRHGSMKRVAAAVGEGASAISSVHAVLGARTY